MAEPRLVDEWLKKAEEDYQFAASVLETSAFYAQILKRHFTVGFFSLDLSPMCVERGYWLPF